VVHRRIESKVRENFNRAIQGQGDNRRKSPTSFFSVIMRLRQAAAHPFMLFSMMRDVFDLEDIKAIRQKFLEIKQRSPERPFIEQVGRWFETRLEDGKLVGQVAPGNLDGPFGIGDHGLSFEMDPQLEQLEKAKALGGSTCNICNQPHVAPRQTRCEHVFCLSCLEALIEIAKEEENDTIECPTCSAEHNVDEIMVPPDAQGGSQSQSRRRSGKKGRNINLDMPGNDCNGFQPVGDEDGAKFLEECDTNINLPLAASAKTAMVKDIILKWQRAKPGDKIIVFTQWVMVGRILGRVLEQEQIKFLYYFGEMSREEKEDNIKDFHSKPDIKVLVSTFHSLETPLMSSAGED
jgi:SNF2 family DNA or RNA helicase